MSETKVSIETDFPVKTADFIRSNALFWQDIRENAEGDVVLIETSPNPVINHSNAVVGKMIAQAKKLRTAWLKTKTTDEALMRSYSPGSECIEPLGLSPVSLAAMLIGAVWGYLSHVLLVNRIHDYRYREVPYGDFIYDNYLSIFSMATLHRWDVRMVRVFFQLMIKDAQARDTLRNNSIKAVLVSHYIGLQTGPLTRVALQKRIPVYWKGGGDGVLNLAIFNSLDQIYDYPKRPHHKDIQDLRRLPTETVESELKDLIKKAEDPFCKTFSVAYDRRVFSDISREEFLKQMALEDRPLVFVMLHAFNDHPHSHFRQMLFKDYFDWFYKTLQYAKNDRSKNWVFKEHPANMMYPTRDMDLRKIMADQPGHVKFVSMDSDIKASTVMNVADLIVTCLGSAGLEMPAMKGIPSIIASDTFYDGFGFTQEPRTQEEYFRMLKDFVPYRLSADQQKTARCCYLYLNKYCMIPFAAGPGITFAERQNPHTLKTLYMERILQNYQEHSAEIYGQFHEYVDLIKAEGFRRLEKIAVLNDQRQR